MAWATGLLDEECKGPERVHGRIVQCGKATVPLQQEQKGEDLMDIHPFHGLR
jgi:hypothetical protein